MKTLQTHSTFQKVTNIGTQTAGYAVTFILAIPLILICMLAGWLYQATERIATRKKLKSKLLERETIDLTDSLSVSRHELARDQAPGRI